MLMRLGAALDSLLARAHKGGKLPLAVDAVRIIPAPWLAARAPLFAAADSHADRTAVHGHGTRDLRFEASQDETDIVLDFALMRAMAIDSRRGRVDQADRDVIDTMAARALWICRRVARVPRLSIVVLQTIDHLHKQAGACYVVVRLSRTEALLNGRGS